MVFESKAEAGRTGDNEDANGCCCCFHDCGGEEGTVAAVVVVPVLVDRGGDDDDVKGYAEEDTEVEVDFFKIEFSGTDDAVGCVVVVVGRWAASPASGAGASYAVAVTGRGGLREEGGLLPPPPDAAVRLR